MSDISYSTEADQSEASFSDYFALLKPRLMSLVVFTALVGLLAAPITVHPMIAFASILFVAVGAGASGALNMWFDADIDQIMKRTASRPIPSGKVTRGEAFAIGMTLSVMSVIMLALAANMLAAFLLAFTIFFYVVVYTMWLKRWTPHNTVIGGAAGAFPPMIGWAIATGEVGMPAVLMFLLIFMWQPAHFWALALFMKSDYEAAGVPMLTVTHGRPATRTHILLYAVLLAPIAIATGFTEIGGPIYLVVSVVLNLLFVGTAIRVWRRPEEAAQADKYKAEKSMFGLSLLYLFLHFGAILAEAALKPWGMGGW